MNATSTRSSTAITSKLDLDIQTLVSVRLSCQVWPRVNLFIVLLPFCKTQALSSGGSDTPPPSPAPSPSPSPLPSPASPTKPRGRPTKDDQKLARWAKANREATEVNVKGQDITDVGAHALASSCPNLTEIDLANTRVTDLGAQAIAALCPGLTDVYLGGTQVTETGIQQMEAALPELTVWVSEGWKKPRERQA